MKTAVLCLAFATLAVVGPSCGGDETAGQRVALKTRLTTDATSFTNALGFTVKVDKALLSVGPLYYFDGEPVTASRGPRPPSRFGLGVAHAHPGHFVPGAAVGQMLVPDTVDLAAGPVSLADGSGVTGTARSGRFRFGVPPIGAKASGLSGKLVRVEGTFTKAGASKAFVATAGVADLQDSAGEDEVDGCVFSSGVITGPGTVTVKIALTTWLDQVDFDKASASDPASLDGTEAGNAFVRGVQKALAYQFSYAK